MWMWVFWAYCLRVFGERTVLCVNRLIPNLSHKPGERNYRKNILLNKNLTFDEKNKQIAKNKKQKCLVCWAERLCGLFWQKPKEQRPESPQEGQERADAARPEPVPPRAADQVLLSGDLTPNTFTPHHQHVLLDQYCCSSCISLVLEMQIHCYGYHCQSYSCQSWKCVLHSLLFSHSSVMSAALPLSNHMFSAGAGVSSWWVSSSSCGSSLRWASERNMSVCSLSVL